MMDKLDELKKLKTQLSNGELTQEQYDAAVIALDDAAYGVDAQAPGYGTDTQYGAQQTYEQDTQQNGAAGSTDTQADGQYDGQPAQGGAANGTGAPYGQGGAQQTYAGQQYQPGQQSYGQGAQQGYAGYGTGQGGAQQTYAGQQQGYTGQQGYAGSQQGYAEQQPGAGPQWQAPYSGYEQKSKLAAGLFGIFLGGIGVHRFYLGYTGIGIGQIAVTLVTCGAGAVWGLIEGILILTGSYITTDANGVPLRE